MRNIKLQDLILNIYIQKLNLIHDIRNSFLFLKIQNKLVS